MHPSVAAYGPVRGIRRETANVSSSVRSHVAELSEGRLAHRWPPTPSQRQPARLHVGKHNDAPPPHKYTVNVSSGYVVEPQIHHHHRLFVQQMLLQIHVDLWSVLFIFWIICADEELFVRCPTNPLAPFGVCFSNLNKPNIKKWTVFV